jgi:hypothetical protein
MEGIYDARKRVGSTPAKAAKKNIIDADPSAEALGYFQTSATRTKTKRRQAGALQSLRREGKHKNRA